MKLRNLVLMVGSVSLSLLRIVAAYPPSPSPLPLFFSSRVFCVFFNFVFSQSPRRRFGASSSRATSAAGGMLTSQSSCSTLSLADRDSRATERDSRATDRNSRATTDRDRDRSRTKSGASREPIAQRYDRTATAGMNRRSVSSGGETGLGRREGGGVLGWEEHCHPPSFSTCALR